MSRPVLRFFGGKFLLAPWIIDHFPPHRIYVEPFGGAASVLMRKQRAYAEIYNDLDSDVVNLFRVLRDPNTALELERQLRLTPFAREEFNASYDKNPANEIDAARNLIIRSFMGFGSDGTNMVRGRTGFRANSNRSGSTPAHDWVNYADYLKSFTERLQGVVIENRQAWEVMEQHDSVDTLHFVDPPYVHDTRGRKDGYRFEMSNGDHLNLIDFLKTLSGAVILCGYDSALYSKLGWHSVSREALADGARERIEVLWLNPKAWDGQSQISFFEGGKNV